MVRADSLGACFFNGAFSMLRPVLPQLSLALLTHSECCCCQPRTDKENKHRKLKVRKQQEGPLPPQESV